MKYEVVMSNRFKRDLKTAKKRGYRIELLEAVVYSLAMGETLNAKYKDHPLSGEYVNMRECHITPDWLLIYQILNDELLLYLTRTGTHSDVF